MEQLKEPFVIVEGEDRAGRKIVFNEKSANGKTFNPWHEIEQTGKMQWPGSIQWILSDITIIFLQESMVRQHYWNKMEVADGSSINDSLSAQQNGITHSK